MSERSYQTIMQPLGLPIKFSPLELGNFGLQIPQSRLDSALSSVLWNPCDDRKIVGSHGILLFGENGCGEEYLIQTVLHQVSSSTSRQVFDITKIPDKSVKILEASVSELFETARKYRSAIITLAEAESILIPTDKQGQVVLDAFQHQLAAASAKQENNIFVIAHIRRPWEINKKVLDLFPTKIHIPSPTEESKLLLMKFWLNEVIRENGLKNKSIPKDSELEELLAQSRFKNITWKEMEKVAYKACSNALLAYLGSRYEKNSTSDEWSPDQAELIKENVKICKDHLKEAFLSLPLQTSNEDETDEIDLEKFIQEWNIPTYENKDSDEGKGSSEFYKEKKPESCMEWFLMAVCSCAETCC